MCFEPRSQFQARYEGHSQDFQIEDAFDLAGDLAEPGFSGSPLIDTDSGAAIAILSGGDHSRKRSWAVPLRVAAVAWPELATVLAWNDANLPRYNDLVNRLGALEVCATQVCCELQRMRDIKYFDAAFCVSRLRVRGALLQFRASAKTAMAIVGGANVGKTWLLCEVAESEFHAPMLFCAAADLRPLNDPPSLPDFLHQALKTAWSERGHVTLAPRPSDLVKALKDGAQPIVIALDGVNEATDVRHFLSRWLPEALAWCQELGVKLLFTTRPEPWPEIARAVPNAELLFTENDRFSLAEQRRAVLEDFDLREAEEAVRKYHLDHIVAEELRRHPLLYRVAAKLGLSAAEARVGRYHLLDAFANQQIDDAVRMIRYHSNGLAHKKVKRLASKLLANGSLSHTFEQASIELGGDELLCGLIAVGLLAHYGDTIRFTYDQVAEAMAPALDVEALFPPAALTDASLFRRSVAGLLRLEADEIEREYSTGLEKLRRVMAEAEGAEWTGVLDGLSYLTLSLPSTQMIAIEAVIAMAVNNISLIVRDRSFSQLVGLVQDAPVSVTERCRILLSLAPWGSAWPFRYWDWSEIERRPAFTSAVEDLYSPNVASALDRLHSRHTDIVRPLLVEALGDEARINKGYDSDSRGEASVASLAAGLLFHRRDEDFESLLDLLSQKRTNAHGWLLPALASELQMEMFSHAFSRIQMAQATPVFVEALGCVWLRVDAATRAKAFPFLESMLQDPSPLGRSAASVLREIDPDHVAAWDRAMDDATDRHSLRYIMDPTPPERFHRAMALAEAYPEAGLDWMSRNDGPEGHQVLMATLAERLLAVKSLRLFPFGRLAEEKIRALLRPDGERFRVWLELARMVLESGEKAALRCLCYAVLAKGIPRDPDVVDLLDRLYQVAGEDEIDVIVGGINKCQSDDPSLWHEYFARARKRHCEAADRRAFDIVLQSVRPHIEREMLLSFWRSLPEAGLSQIAAKILTMLENGNSIEAVFARSCQNILNCDQEI